MREVLSKSLTPRGYINYEFTARRCRRWTNPLSRGYMTDGLENALAALLQGHNFGEALVRIAPPA
jgi:NADPH-dependent curcumin reductase CurA